MTADSHLTDAEYCAAMEVINDARQERKALQLQKMLEDSMLDAYEEVERITCCDLNEIGG